MKKFILFIKLIFITVNLSSQNNNIGLNKSSHNIININNGNQILSYDLNVKSELDNLLKLLISFEKTSNENKKILEVQLNQNKHLSKISDKLDFLINILEESNIENEINTDTLNAKIDEYRIENEKLILENNALKLKVNNNEIKMQLSEAEKCLKMYDNQCYINKLEEIKFNLYRFKNEMEDNISELSYLQAVNLVNNNKLIEALSKLEEAISLNSESSKYNICNAAILCNLGRYDDAKPILDTLMNRDLDLKTKAHNYTLLANIEVNKNKNYNIGIKLLKQSSEIYDKNDYLSEYTQIQSSLRKLYLLAGDTLNAILCEYRLCEIYKKNGYMGGVALCYNNIGILLGKWVTPKIGIRYLTKSIQIYKTQIDTINYGIPTSFSDNLFHLYKLENKLDSAFILLNDVEDYTIKYCKDNKMILSNLYWLIGNKLFIESMYDKSISYYIKDYDISITFNDTSSQKIRNLTYQIGLNYLKLHNYELAYHNFMIPLLKFSIFEVDYLSKLYEHLSYLTILFGEKEMGLKYLEYFRKHNKWSDEQEVIYLNNIGEKFYQNDDFEKSIKLYESCLELISLYGLPKKSKIYVVVTFNLAKSQYKIGNINLAAKYIKQANLSMKKSFTSKNERNVIKEKQREFINK